MRRSLTFRAMGEKKPSFGDVARSLSLQRGDIAIIVVFGAVAGGLTLVVPVAVQSFVNTIAFTQLAQPLVLLTAVVAGVLCISGFARLCQSVAVEHLQRRLFDRLVARLAVGLPRALPATYQNWRGSQLSARFFEIVTIQKVVSTLLLDGVATVLQTLLAMILLAFYHPALLAFDIVLVIILALIIFGLAKGGIKTAKAESVAKYEVHQNIDDLTRNPLAFRTPQRAGYAATRLDESTQAWLVARAQHFRVVLRQHIGVVVLQAAASAALLAVGGTMVLKQQLSLGQLVAAEIVVAAVLAGASRLPKYLESLYDLFASSGKLAEVFAIPVEAQRGGEATAPTAPVRLEVKDATFTYPGAHEPVFENVALQIAPGAHVAIIGETGSGKSAIASVLALQARPQTGHVAIDGIDGREWHLLRDRIALVSRAEIIAGSVLDNLSVGRELPVDSAYAALQDAGLTDAVNALADGAHTSLDASDVPLSAGEQVQLCIARALAQAPRLLIIDGLLDQVDDGVAKSLLHTLTRPQAPWTLVVTTKSRAVASAFSHVIEMSALGNVRSA